MTDYIFGIHFQTIDNSLIQRGIATGRGQHWILNQLVKYGGYTHTHTFSPLSLDTCLLSFISHLLPRIILSTSEDACWKDNKWLFYINLHTLDSAKQWRSQLCVQIVIAQVGLTKMLSTNVFFNFFTCLQSMNHYTNLFNIADPVLDVVEGLLIGDVIHQHDALEHKEQEMVPKEVTCSLTLAGSAQPSGIQVVTSVMKVTQLHVWLVLVKQTSWSLSRNWAPIWLLYIFQSTFAPDKHVSKYYEDKDLDSWVKNSKGKRLLQSVFEMEQSPWESVRLRFELH